MYQTSIAYFHIQESEPSATSLLTDDRKIPIYREKNADFDQWHRTIVNVTSKFNTAASHYYVLYDEMCDKILIQGDEIKIIKYKMSS